MEFHFAYPPCPRCLVYCCQEFFISMVYIRSECPLAQSWYLRVLKGSDLASLGLRDDGELYKLCEKVDSLIASMTQDDNLPAFT